MRLSLSWVQTFLTKIPEPELLAEQLTIAGIPVERIERTTIPSTVVVGRVLSVSQHPNANRLRVARVDLGKGRHEQIVCGAPNLAADQRVAVALPGTTLPNGASITTATIRGTASAGMICAEDELGLGSDHTGILVLEQNVEIGRPLAGVLGRDETVLDLEVTPNRADCLSVLGCAREISAITGAKLLFPKEKQKKDGALSPKVLKVRVEEKRACPWYGARVVEGVHRMPSPDWMQARLRASGIRPLNIVIDVTNYVMLELGQPLHAFDARALPDRKLVVRNARAGERLLALDGKTYDLAPTTLVIASSKKPVAIAGIMGGEESGIQENTTSVILEAAVFDAKNIRLTSKRLGCASESSYRFERTVDPHMTARALDRAAQLLVELAHGTCVRGSAVVGAKPKKPVAIKVSSDRVNAVLNLHLTPPAIARLLKRDGCTVTGAGRSFRVTPPSWRRDLVLEEDYLEEVGRIYGYPKLPLSMPVGTLVASELPPLWRLKESFTDALAAFGGTECKHYPFYDEKRAQLFGLDVNAHVRVVNPLSHEQALLRLQLLPILLKKSGVASREDSMLFWYEIGRCFRESGQAQPDEHEHIAVVTVGPDSYRTLKGVITAALEMLHVPKETVAWQTGETRYGPGQMVTLGGKTAGHCSALSPTLRDHHKFRQEVTVAELQLEPILAVQGEGRYEALSPFPALRRDLAFWLSEDVPFADVEKALAAIDPLLVDHELFDVYLSKNRRSLALRLTFQSKERTLTSAEIDTIMQKITATLSKTVHAEMRTE